MEAQAVTTTEYKRYTGGIFGEVERFGIAREHRVQVKIGNSYFISNKTYSSFEAARRAALRLAARGAVAQQQQGEREEV